MNFPPYAIDLGERLHRCFQQQLATFGVIPFNGPREDWNALPQEFRDAWTASAVLIPSGAIPSSSQQRSGPVWDALRKYGRHDMRCPTNAACTCGFDAIEREILSQ